MTKRKNSKNHSPKCAMPGCTKSVGTHNTIAYNSNGAATAKYKTVCNYHRTTGKAAVDLFKIERGCANVDGRLGTPCTATNLGAESLTIDHIDGNKHNTAEDNIQVLCANCHNKKTIQNKDNRSQKDKGFEVRHSTFDYFYN